MGDLAADPPASASASYSLGERRATHTLTQIQIQTQTHAHPTRQLRPQTTPKFKFSSLWVGFYFVLSQYYDYDNLQLTPLVPAIFAMYHNKLRQVSENQRNLKLGETKKQRFRFPYIASSSY
jgi:hypothetical protein